MDEKNNHIPYLHVSMPAGAAEIIRYNLEWARPSDLVTQVQMVYPSVTSKQIHRAWRRMSEELWKRDDDPIISAERLLQEFQESPSSGVQLLKLDGIPEDVEILAFAFPRVINALQSEDSKIKEIGMDATYM